MKKYLVFLSFFLATQAIAADFVNIQNKKNEELHQLQKGISVVNLWATWCAPCREEMPELSQFAVKNPQIRVIGIALDQENNIRTFLQKTPVRYPIWRYTGQDSSAMMQTLGNTVGGLPYTVVMAPNCRFQKPFFGKITASQLQSAIQEVHSQCKQSSGKSK